MIHDDLLNSPAFREGVDILFRHKPKKKSFSKANEEASELSTILLQQRNKPEVVSDRDVVEELVDMQMHLLLMQKYFDPELVRQITHEKIAKMMNSKDFKKYAERAFRVDK